MRTRAQRPTARTRTMRSTSCLEAPFGASARPGGAAPITRVLLGFVPALSRWRAGTGLLWSYACAYGSPLRAPIAPLRSASRVPRKGALCPIPSEPEGCALRTPFNDLRGVPRCLSVEAAGELDEQPSLRGLSDEDGHPMCADTQLVGELVAWDLDVAAVIHV